MITQGDIVTLKGGGRGRWFQVAHVYPPGFVDRWEALIVPWGETWDKAQRLVPLADLVQVPVDFN